MQQMKRQAQGRARGRGRGERGTGRGATVRRRGLGTCVTLHCSHYCDHV